LEKTAGNEMRLYISEKKVIEGKEMNFGKLSRPAKKGKSPRSAKKHPNHHAKPYWEGGGYIIIGTHRETCTEKKNKAGGVAQKGELILFYVVRGQSTGRGKPKITTERPLVSLGGARLAGEKWRGKKKSHLQTSWRDYKKKTGGPAPTKK